MPSEKFLDGESLTGRQAGIIAMGFLTFVVLSGLLLVLLRNFF